jgi:hypothetical protein
MDKKLMITEGFRIESEQDLKDVIDIFTKKHPDFINDGMKKGNIVKLYRKRTKPYKHVVFFQIESSWFLQFLTDKEVLHRIPA